MEIENQIDEPVETTLREDLENAVKEVNELIEKPEVQESVEKPIKERDETGKFAKKEVTEKQVTEKVATTEPVKTAIAPPNTWTPAAKAKWNELPPDIQSEISKREADVEKGFTKLEEERSIGKSFKEVVTPYMAMINAEGSTPLVAIQSLLNTAHKLRTSSPQDKAAMIIEMAKTFGADMSQITQVSQAQPQIDPQLRAIQQELAQLKNARQQDLSEKEQHEQAANKSAIDTFASNPEHIHFETVKAHMASLLKSGLTKGSSNAEHLKDAYDQAVWARPDIRSTLLEAEKHQMEAKRVAEAKEKADKARKASVSISGSPGASAPSKANNEDRSLREELEANLAAFISH